VNLQLCLGQTNEAHAGEPIGAFPWGLSEISCEGQTVGKKETSYGETEATGYFRRAA
jgi:hypothetical protein